MVRGTPYPVKGEKCHVNVTIFKGLGLVRETPYLKVETYGVSTTIPKRLRIMVRETPH